MNTVYYDEISFEGITFKAFQVRVVIHVNDKKAVNSRVIFNKTVSLPVFIIASVPFFMFVLISAIMTWIFSFTCKQEAIEMSYEETQQYFKEGKGYFNQLSTEEKELFFKRSHL